MITVYFTLNGMSKL